MPGLGDSDTALPDAKSLIGDEEESGLEGNIRLLFDKSVSTVQTYSSKIKKEYIKPAYGKSKAFHGTYPVLSLYFGFYLILSVFPILLFLGLSLLVLSASVTLALALGIIFSASVISFFILILVFTLFWTSLTSIVATLFVLAAYQFVRLVTLVRGRPNWQTGIRLWISELRSALLLRLPNKGVDESAAEFPGVKVEVEERDTDVIQL